MRTLLAALAIAALGLPLPAQGQAVTDQWSAATMPDAPPVKSVTVDPKTTALIVMDFNKQGCTAEKRPRCVADVPHIQKLLQEARAHGLFVIHTLAGSTTGADELPALAAQGSEQAFHAAPDKFIPDPGNLDLQGLLKARGITTLITVGTSANGAVIYTASSAAFHGYKVIVPVDGIPADTPFAEAMTVWELAHAPRVADALTLTKVDLISFAS